MAGGCGLAGATHTKAITFSPISFIYVSLAAFVVDYSSILQ